MDLVACVGVYYCFYEFVSASKQENLWNLNVVWENQNIFVYIFFVDHHTRHRLQVKKVPSKRSFWNERLKTNLMGNLEKERTHATLLR